MSKSTLTTEDLDSFHNDFASDGSFDLEARLLSTDELSPSLPSMSFAANATYTREGSDLVLTHGDESVVVKNYFTTPTPPALTALDGAVISPEIVASFLQGGSEQDFYAASLLQRLLGGDEAKLSKDAVAVVENLDGSVLVIRNGKAIALQDGDQLFQGDEITTTAGASTSLVFADGTQFKLGGEARISLDQFSYEASTSTGLQIVSILSGAFSYASGLIAKNDPADVQLRTPVGEIGIRGTKIVGEVDADKAQAQITVLEGRILYQTPQGDEYELDQGFETLQIRNGGARVKETTISADRAAKNYDVFDGANDVSDFIQQEPLAQQEQGDAGASGDLALPDISYNEAIAQNENLVVATDANDNLRQNENLVVATDINDDLTPSPVINQNPDIVELELPLNPVAKIDPVAKTEEQLQDAIKRLTDGTATEEEIEEELGEKFAVVTDSTTGELKIVTESNRLDQRQLSEITDNSKIVINIEEQDGKILIRKASEGAIKFVIEGSSDNAADYKVSASRVRNDDSAEQYTLVESVLDTLTNSYSDDRGASRNYEGDVYGDKPDTDEPDVYNNDLLLTLTFKAGTSDEATFDILLVDYYLPPHVVNGQLIDSSPEGTFTDNPVYSIDTPPLNTGLHDVNVLAKPEAAQSSFGG